MVGEATKDVVVDDGSGASSRYRLKAASSSGLALDAGPDSSSITATR